MTNDNEARVQELRQLIEAYASMRYRSGAMNYSASDELQEEARVAVQAAYEPLDAALRSLAATQVPEHWKVVNEAQRAYGGIVKAAINLIAEVDERHDTKDVPLKHTVPYAAVVALRAAIEGFPPAPQAATQGEAGEDKLITDPELQFLNRQWSKS